MKKVFLGLLFLICICVIPSCSKVGSKADLVGTWKAIKEMYCFNGDIVSEKAASSDEDITISEHSITAGATALPYTYEKGAIRYYDRGYDNSLKVVTLTDSELVIEQPHYFIYNGGDMNKIEPAYKRFTGEEEIYINYKGEKIYVGAQNDSFEVIFFFYDSKGNKQPCALLNHDWAYFSMSLIKAAISTDAVFYTSTRIQYRKL